MQKKRHYLKVNIEKINFKIGLSFLTLLSLTEEEEPGWHGGLIR